MMYQLKQPEFTDLGVTDYIDITWDDPFLCSIQNARYTAIGLESTDNRLVSRNSALSGGYENSLAAKQS